MRRRAAVHTSLVMVLALALPTSAGATGRVPSNGLEALSNALSFAPLPSGALCPVDLELETLGLPPRAMCGDTGAGGAAPATAGDLAFEARGSLQTPRWYADLQPLPGGPEGSFLRVHGYGDVAAMAADGSTIWNRPSMSFYDDWGLHPQLVPFVLIGVSSLNPFVLVSERPYAVADLTEDGLADVALGHVIIQLGPDGRTYERTLSAVTVLDGRDGRTLWHRLFPGYVTQVLVEDGVLIVGNETGDPGADPYGIRAGEPGTITTLQAFRLGGDPLDAVPIWSLPFQEWARLLSVELAGPGRVAAAWTAKPLGTAGDAGTVLLLDVADGAVRWARTTQGYPRLLRYDPTRNRVLVQELADPISGVDIRTDYALSSLRAEDGGEALRVERPDAILLSLELADLVGGNGSEWVVGDAEIVDLPANTAGVRDVADVALAGRLTAIDGDSGSAAWTRRRLANSLALPYGLAIDHAAKMVGVAAVVSGPLRPPTEELYLYNGRNATAPVWVVSEGSPFPVFLSWYEAAGKKGFLGSTPDHEVRIYDRGSGGLLLDEPLLSEINAVDAVQVGGDTTLDLVVGTSSGAVAALDGAALDEVPEVLWRARVSGPVRRLEVADLDADGDQEVVVVDTRSLRVLRLADGKSLFTVLMPEEYVWTFALGDLDGQPGLEIVVPTTTLAVYDAEGTPLWRHESRGVAHFSTPAVTPDRRVVVQLTTIAVNGHSQNVVALEGATGQVAWTDTGFSYGRESDIWRSVYADPDIPGAGKHGVAVTYRMGTGPAGFLGLYAPRTDVYDSRTGQLRWSAGPSQAATSPHFGHLTADGTLVEHNWSTVAGLRSDGTAESAPDAINTGAVKCDFGPLGRYVVVARDGLIKAAPSDAFGGTLSPQFTSLWKRLLPGSVLARDLDGDGADEVVAWDFDWDGFAEVASFAGYLVGHGDIRPHGIQVLEAV